MSRTAVLAVVLFDGRRVGESVRELVEIIEKGSDVDEAVVERVKDCGLGRS